MAIPSLTPVVSSWVAAIGYEGGDLYLRVRDGGAIYRYSGVPRYVYHLLRDAGSKGRAFSRLALRKYGGERVG